MLLDRIKTRSRDFRLYRALRFVWHFASDGVFRHDQIRRWRKPRGQFQYRSLTKADRYPRIFTFLQAELAAHENPRLLSFGCATGEEVFSLRRYLPRAVIKGIDINPHNIEVGQARLKGEGDIRSFFQCASSVEAESTASYDAVLCMAVFQHSALKDPVIVSCANYIRFEDFERTLADIARILKPGGLLAIRHANFDFCDTVVSAGFGSVFRIEPDGHPQPRFGRDNRRRPAAPDTDVVYRKK